MISSLRAELIRLGRWPTTWILCGTWLLLNLTFGYLLPYLSYRNEGTGFRGGAGLAQTLPDRVPVTMIQGLPLFGGALLLILGAVTIGSGYGWGTWKTVFTTGPRRATALAGTAAALGTVIVGLIVVTFGLDLATAYLVAGVESADTTGPAVGEVVRGLGAGLLIAAMWTGAGVLLGTLTRGPALAIGLGLVWTLVVENLLRGVSGLLGPVKAVTDLLPGTAAGSLVGAFGGVSPGDPNATPGVSTVIGGTTALVLLAAYVVVFLGASLALTSRRDLAG
jgi:ABC-2 type transport system permease protein